MRHFDIDQPQRFRTWPGLPPRPAAGGGQGARPRPVAHALRGGVLGAGRLVEGAAVAAAGLSVPLLAGGATAGPLAIAAVALLAVHALAAVGLYDDAEEYGSRRSVVLALAMTALAVPLAATVAAWLDGGRPGAALARLTDGAMWNWAVLAALAVAAFRAAFGRMLDRLGRWPGVARRVLVIGERERALEVLSLLAGPGRRWAFPVAVCLDREAPERPILGGFITGLDDAEAIIRREGVDDVVVALPWGDGARLAACLDVLRPLAVDVHLFPETAAPYAGGGALSLLAGVPMARVGVRPLAGMRAVLKGLEDRGLGVLLLALAAPLMLLIAVAVKLDSRGPVLFRQQRYGYDNQPFTCLKFRTMAVAEAEAEVRQATRDDPRVTRIGRVLRRTSLDELPQLLNVVAGSMSLVGPRPHAVSHHHTYARLVDDYRCRHRMKPGITGWAQVNGYRGETATVEMMRKRVVHDLWYIDHWSLWLDLTILARTPLACLKGTNAY